MKDNLTQSIFNIKADVEENITFAFVSDLHDRTNEPMLKIFEDNSTDAVLVGGDFIHNGKKYERGLEFLKLSSERYPTFVEIGNHETKSGLDIIRLVKESGAILLDDTFTEYKGVIIGGLTTGFGFGQKQSAFMRTPEPHLGWLKEFQAQNGYRILLNHHPEYYPRYLKDMDIDLILSGHAHGGQWRLGKYGLIAPGQGLFPKYTSGMYDHRLIVSRGANSINLIPRINNKPEVVIIRLEKKNG